jgi:hypothetical protein
MSKSRAERRHNHERMLDRVKKFRWLQPEFWHGDEKSREKHIRQMAETRKPCSCHMCGNPRKMFKEKTIQEKRFNQVDE